jgi:hypothetical protein
MKDVQRLREADIVSGKDLQQVERNHKVPKRKTRRNLENFNVPRQQVQDTLKENLGAIECESAVEQYQEMCLRYCECFGWKS